MELRQLRYFVAIADSGSVTKAAERVFVAQSALSHQLAQLEGELGVSLFERSRRGVGLTEAGQRFFPHAVSILRQAEEAVASARSTSQEPEGTVVFGLPHSASSALALPLLREVRQRFPRVTLELTEELTGNLSRQLRTGQIQLAVLFDDGQLGGFSVTPVLSEQLCLIEPASAPRTGRRSRTLSLQQALAQPLILPASPHGVRPIIEAAAAAAGLPPPRVEADISSISILRTTLLAGLGRTLLPVMPLQADIDAGQLRATPVGHPPLERVLAVCSSAHIPRSTACQAVAALAVETMQQLCRQGQWAGARSLVR
ncbi:LysR substrate-binding domain-containing protein [Hydrogenophaga luteola]|uniref:LysR substrate-binding domain-containing protein n=1 Tax=Hydrogenophaga luteola TaxID=1591122 RepID=A0ABV7VYH5_9BURK